MPLLQSPQRPKRGQSSDLPFIPGRIYTLFSGMMTENTVSHRFAGDILPGPKKRAAFRWLCGSRFAGREFLRRQPRRYGGSEQRRQADVASLRGGEVRLQRSRAPAPPDRFCGSHRAAACHPGPRRRTRPRVDGRGNSKSPAANPGHDSATGRESGPVTGDERAHQPPMPFSSFFTRSKSPPSRFRYMLVAAPLSLVWRYTRTPWNLAGDRR